MVSSADVVVDFYGICSHFLGVVPGVPHRVVLPDAFAWRPGVIVQPEPALYLLHPHFAFVVDGERNPLVDVPGLIEDGWIVSPVRLEIVNASDDALDYPESDLGKAEPFGALIPKLTSFTQSYAFDDGVVLGGRAACYFDISRGRVVAVFRGAARHARISMKTSGPPMLRVTPLMSHRNDGPFFTEIPVGSSLIVGNGGLSCKDAQVDFLWHLTTDQSGIGQFLESMPFGYSSLPKSFDADCAKKNFERLLDLGYPGRLRLLPGKLHEAWETTASCSNSQYP